MSKTNPIEQLDSSCEGDALQRLQDPESAFRDRGSIPVNRAGVQMSKTNPIGQLDPRCEANAFQRLESAFNCLIGVVLQ